MRRSAACRAVREVFRSFRNWGFVPDIFRSRWDRAAVVDSYPRTRASLPPNRAAPLFEVRLPQPMEVHAIRIVGKPAGDYVSCAELGAYV